ncbi:Rrf2 family transcriptional regulator [Hyphococcus sp.]|uniref:Rrf2 family transcriptional regulator n=1 Tax=Hyphococcus sp. TaxID=2038636 RepID=UPI003CCBB0BB
MAGSTRFAVAVHLLTMMCADRRRPITSQALAKSANTNAAVVRRILGSLSRAGLTVTQLGKGGGAMLAKGPKKITLLDIYLAVEEPGLIPLHRAAPDPVCPVGGNIQAALTQVTADAENAFQNVLARVTLKQIAKEIAAKNAAAKSAA